MTNNKQEVKKKKKKKEDWPLSHCTKAPAAEHFRSSDDDEPCDDARATDFLNETDNGAQQ